MLSLKSTLSWLTNEITNCMVLMKLLSNQQKQRLVTIDVKINTPVEVIKPIKTEKLLGIHIQNDLKWTEYTQGPTFTISLLSPQ